jgi:hypothetical protein
MLLRVENKADSELMVWFSRILRPCGAHVVDSDDSVLNGVLDILSNIQRSLEVLLLGCI